MQSAIVALGDFFIAATKVGICQLDFLNPYAITDSVSKLNLAWPLANITPSTPRFLTSVEAFFQGQYCDTKQLSLHMTGTDFQIKVWQALLKIPAGNTITYSDIARSINHPKAVRACGDGCWVKSVGFLCPVTELYEMELWAVTVGEPSQAGNTQLGKAPVNLRSVFKTIYKPVTAFISRKSSTQTHPIPCRYQIACNHQMAPHNRDAPFNRTIPARNWLATRCALSLSGGTEVSRQSVVCIIGTNGFLFSIKGDYS